MTLSRPLRPMFRRCVAVNWLLCAVLLHQHTCSMDGGGEGVKVSFPFAPWVSYSVFSFFHPFGILFSFSSLVFFLPLSFFFSFFFPSFSLFLFFSFFFLPFLLLVRSFSSFPFSDRLVSSFLKNKNKESFKLAWHIIRNGMHRDHGCCR